jgi:hypothetical protein
MHIEEAVYQINDFIETLGFKGRFAAFPWRSSIPKRGSSVSATPETISSTSMTLWKRK